MEKHVRLLGILYIVYGALHVFGGLVALVFLRWSGFIHTALSGRTVGFFLLANMAVTVLLLFVLLVSIACILGGIGLLNRQRGARIAVLVLSFLNLIHFPLGTALGGYGIWVLMKEETDRLFPGMTDPTVQQGTAQQ